MEQRLIVRYAINCKRACKRLQVSRRMVCMDRTHLLLPRPLREEAKTLARTLDTSMAALIRAAIREYIERHTTQNKVAK